jgi:hypothetical protein
MSREGFIFYKTFIIRRRNKRKIKTFVMKISIIALIVVNLKRMEINSIPLISGVNDNAMHVSVRMVIEQTKIFSIVKMKCGVIFMR